MTIYNQLGCLGYNGLYQESILVGYLKDIMKDYAHRPSFHRKPHRHSASMTKIGLISALILSGLIVAFFFFRTPTPPSIEASKVTAPKVKKKSTHHAAAQPTEPAEPDNRFDFYTLLPNTAVDIPNTADTPTTAQPPPSQGSFIIQAGSFLQGEDAEKLRASLALLGFEARVQAVSITQNQTRYRVYLGPFASEQLASEAKTRLDIPDALILKNH